MGKAWLEFLSFTGHFRGMHHASLNCKVDTTDLIVRGPLIIAAPLHF